MPDLNSNFDLTFSQLMQIAPEQNLLSASTSKAEYMDLDASKMLLEVIKNGANYNIYFVAHIGSSDIEKQSSYNLFGESLSAIFAESIIIPEVCDNPSQEKSKILSALEWINKDNIKRELEKGGEMTEQELYRCFYVAGDGYTQIIPYEWR